jgi:hypothetical protein
MTVTCAVGFCLFDEKVTAVKISAILGILVCVMILNAVSDEPEDAGEEGGLSNVTITGKDEVSGSGGEGGRAMQMVETRTMV